MSDSKKIGILTYHRSHNYGALLQALALRKVISDLGHTVNIIDYWPEYHRDMYKLIPSSFLKGKNVAQKAKRYLSTGLRMHRLVKRRNIFFKFIRDYIEPVSRPTNEHFDVVVCGSDQIWRKQEALGNKFNPIYFGAGPLHTESYISYAASMGKLTDSEKDKQQLHDWLSSFDAISVRETDLKELLKSSGISDVTQVVDPTLLLNADQWRQLLPIRKPRFKRPYILYYDLMQDSFDLAAIRKFAAERGLDLRIMPGNLDRFRYPSDYLPYAGPLEMLSLISNAEVVFTSSFHGLAFALIFGKEVYAAFDHNAGRARSLLEAAGCTDRLLTPMLKDIPELPAIDYAKVEKRLDALRAHSTEFLKTALQPS